MASPSVGIVKYILNTGMIRGAALFWFFVPVLLFTTFCHLQ
uniref:Uncharacterized protein n=1 Tax=Anguilla anguilla TaxID=7936 RepID=A0A0E9QKF2_ANGAN